jgi:hypothetical protein
MQETNIALPHSLHPLLKNIQQLVRLSRIKFKRVLLSIFGCYAQVIKKSQPPPQE